jgi:hypothetical protein
MLCPPDFSRFVPIVLQNDFAHPSAQDRFKIGRQRAMLIQKSIRPDSIVQISISQLRRGEFCNPIGG